MAPGKSSGLARYSVDVLRSCHASLYELLAAMFTCFARSGYPRVLNTLLLMPLFKSRGARDLCTNYRGISLIHPIGRLFSKCFEARLLADPGSTRARGQAGFRQGYRTEDNLSILQLQC